MRSILLALILTGVSTTADAVDPMDYLRIVTGRVITNDATVEVWFQVSTIGDFPIAEADVSCTIKNRLGRPLVEIAAVVRNVQNQGPVTARPKIILAGDEIRGTRTHPVASWLPARTVD